VEDEMCNGKIARMPTGEVVVGPWRRLEERKRRAIIDSLWAQERDDNEKYELIKRILGSMGWELFDFAELTLVVAEENFGFRPTIWRRIEEEPKQMSRRA
jgi:hypothetical protein